MSLGFNNQTQQQIATQSCVKEPSFTHAIAIGQTGCGKTTGFILPHLKDRIERGHGVLMFDYKGKEHRSLKAIALQAGAIDRVEELGKPWGMQINLLKMLGENGLVALMGELGDSKDRFWSESAAALVRNTYRLLLHGHRLAKKGACDPLKAPMPTLRSIFETLNSAESLQQTLDLYEEIATISSAHIHSSAEQGAPIELLAFILREAETIQGILKDLEGYRDARLIKQENAASGHLGILLSASAVLREFAAHSSINAPNGADLIEKLSEGALVSIDTQELSVSVMRPLMSSVVARLVKHTSQLDPGRPVSIFADEAQRVLDAQTDLGDDVLRESRVELILATQDLAQLTQVLGSEKTRSLMTNVKEQFFFKGQPIGWAGYDHLRTEGLAEFAYLQPGEKPRTLKAEPLFIDEADRIYALWAYQQSKPALRSLTDGHKPALLHYNEEMFKESGELEARELSDDKRTLSGNRYRINALVALTEESTFNNMLKLLDELSFNRPSVASPARVSIQRV